MDIRYYHLSSQGMRERNEDCIEFWKPSTPQEWRGRGAVMLIADGVGGQGDGEIASRTAVNTALNVFQSAPLGTPPEALLRQMFDAANLAVYDIGMENAQSNHYAKRMATTMTASILRNDRIHVGHVGDTRAYSIHAGKINRLTSDHSYSGVQLKLGLINVHEAANSDLRCVLTRSIGQDPFVRIDTHTVTLDPGDFFVQCSDGLYCAMSELEMQNIITRWPEQAISELRDLCERRKSDDNFSVQILHVHEVERVVHKRTGSEYSKVIDATLQHDVDVGQLLDGRYKIIDKLSVSGMASIFKATDLTDNSTVAIKIPLLRFESDPGFFDRFKREQEIGERLRHRFIMRVEPDDGKRSRPYMVMEYIQGQTLGALMHSVGVIPANDALQIAAYVCDALQYMHEQDVVHRDLKPDNIMICDDGTIRIIDFGIAKVQGARRLTFGGFQPAMGTPDYMAPEQVKGKRGDARTDIYSLGAILYEMATGKPPFEGVNPLVIMNARLTGDPISPRKQNSQVFAQMEEIILHAMERNPDDRYQTAGEMKKDLEHPDAVEITGRVDRLEEPRLPKSAWRPNLWVAAGVAFPVLLVIFLYLMQHLRWK